MTQRKALTDKVLLLGVDGMDPRLTRKYVDMGILPNLKKYIEQGAQRHDLTMLGGHPTVTPPMWTTMATGCYSNVHGITGAFKKGSDLGSMVYNMDSRLCKAEPLWNVLVEAGKKTLVWHWPGATWPPSSDNPNLMVVDGSSPGGVCMSANQVDPEYLVGASEDIREVTFKTKGASDARAACVITPDDFETTPADALDTSGLAEKMKTMEITTVLYKESQQTAWMSEAGVDLAQSPIKPASGWTQAPADAKEFTVLLSGGLIRRPSLILKNDAGIYDRVALYKSKKETEPLVVLPLGEFVIEIIDDAIKNDKIYRVNRNMKLLKLDPEGKSLTIYVSASMDTENDSLWHPKRLFKEVSENVGYPMPTSMIGCQDPLLITDCMLANWQATADWQADSIHYLIEKEELDVVFSHFHNVDLEAHMFIKHLAERPFNRQSVDVVQKWMQDLYIQTDYYLGKFLHFLDEGWTIIIFSDHAQVASKHAIPMLMDVNGICTPVMEELGFTVTKDNGSGGREIDWDKTRAVIQREGHIYLNLKGREPHGIVDPADQYELEEEIMTGLYGYKDKETGHRICSVALRNRDAVLLGMGGPESGDIICWHAEGYNFDHADCLSTTWGESDTSVSPIFIAAGKGLKKGYETERIIRQIDLVPTVAVLSGVRMPRECEGAPVYQIFEEEF